MGCGPDGQPYSGGGTVSFTPSSRQLGGVDGAGAPVSGSEPLAVFGNAITSRIDSRPARIATIRSMPKRDAAVRRRAVAQRVEQEAEARLRLLLGDAEHVEDLLLDLGAVDTDRPAADLHAVEHHVVAARAHRARVVEGAERRGERVVQRVPAALGLVALEHRQVDDPERVVAALGDEVEAPRELQAQLAERGGGDVGLVGDDQQQVAGLAAQRAA